MSQALYRKHRPKKLTEVVGQEHITTALDNALKSGKIAHAYLFTGPRGTGKTSVARILAHEVNQLPYSDESTHLDIIEIDAASNRRIDEIRDLRDKVHISPTSAKYKVYIIDEVHMLTREAFNALLKTLEEPPAHVIFILATTEVHKLPETIISRTQRFSFKPGGRESVVQHLATIARTEGIDIDEAGLKLLAEHGDGSFRDSVGLLDQAGSLGGKLGLDEVQRLLGLAPHDLLQQLLESVQGTDVQGLLALLAAIRGAGVQSATIARQVGTMLRQQLVDGGLQLSSADTLSLLRNLLDIASSSQPDRLLDLCLLDVVLAHAPIDSASVAPPMLQPPAPPPQAVLTPRIPDTAPVTLEVARPVAGGEFVTVVWPAILDDVKKSHSTLYSLLRMGLPSVEDDTLTIAFRFPFHQKQLQQAKNQQKLAETIAKHHAAGYKITVVLSPDLVGPMPAADQDQDEPEPTTAQNSELNTISNIFGGGELLES